MAEIKLDISAVVNEVLKLMLQFENKRQMNGRAKKELLLKVIKNHYTNLTDDHMELISNFVDVIVLFHKIHRGSSLFKSCWKCS